VISIGKHQVGEGAKPFIIAEVGSNWSGFDDCKDSIAKAAACGADAVKFQAYSYEALYGRSVDKEMMFLTEEYWREQRRELPVEWLPRLKAKADACGIEFMCSAFSPELVEAVDPYVNVHKVASAEMTHLRILQKLAKLGKPVILSTGASGEADIKGALEVLKGVPVILMYCVAAYPAQEINLEVLGLLKKKFGTLVGYSDHSTDVAIIPKEAVARGACVIEKHFTNIPGVVTPDQGHSLDPGRFKRMVESIHRRLEPRIGPNSEETGMITRHNRRVLAIADIDAGQTLQEGVNFGIYRSLKDDAVAAHPFMIDAMIGKPVKRAIRAGDGIGPGDV
jgi:N,N'-diacetyllegionaminate synthase